MLRSGTAPETTAIELGLPVAEVRLLEKVGNFLASAEYLDEPAGPELSRS